MATATWIKNALEQRGIAFEEIRASRGLHISGSGAERACQRTSAGKGRGDHRQRAYRSSLSFRPAGESSWTRFSRYSG